MENEVKTDDPKAVCFSMCGQWRKAEPSHFRGDKVKPSGGVVPFSEST